MAKDIKIAPVEQYIIDQVRKIRISLNITAESLSTKVSPSGSVAFIGNIESSVTPTTYTDHHLNIIARIFSEHARDLNDDSIKADYTIYDFYPEKPLNDHPLTKTAVPILKQDGPTSALNEIIDKTNYLDEPKTLKQITEYSNQERNREWKPNNFTSPIGEAVKNKKIKRIDLKDGSVKYQKNKSKS